ncbi:MAG: YitT family protein [Bacteroidaceae bacterium]
MTIKKILGEDPRSLLRDYAQIILGIFIYTLGYTCFLLPYQIITGGLSGVSTIIYYVAGIHPNLTYLCINGVLILLAGRIMGWRYMVRTLVATFVISFFIGTMQEYLTVTGPDGKEQLRMIIGDQKFMACVIGGIMEGLGLAIVFLAGGSTGGTDIIASSINKYRNISLGRLLLFIDVVIIAGSFLLFRNLEIMVIGYVTMFISMNFLDFVINGARQSVQFIIVSSKPEEIAHEINVRLDRGVTILYGEGFYTKEKRQVLLILAKKYESRQIFMLIKQIDGNAFVSMSNVEGVFGEGFDTIKK